MMQFFRTLTNSQQLFYEKSQVKFFLHSFLFFVFTHSNPQTLCPSNPHQRPKTKQTKSKRPSLKAHKRCTKPVHSKKPPSAPLGKLSTFPNKGPPQQISPTSLLLDNSRL